jgi:predicted RNA methylase
MTFDIVVTWQISLEQYPTSAHLAAVLLTTASNSFDDIVGKSVVDLGCGTGMLACAASLIGAALMLLLRC